MRGGFAAAVCACALVACGSSASAGGSSPRASPTSDPEVARVKAAVTAFITDMVASEATGDSSAARALTVPGSHAVGNSDEFAAVPLGTGHGYKSTRLQLTGWHITVAYGSASVHVTSSGSGIPIRFPSGAPEGPERAAMTLQWSLQLQEFSGQWLVASF